MADKSPLVLQDSIPRQKPIRDHHHHGSTAYYWLTWGRKFRWTLWIEWRFVNYESGKSLRWRTGLLMPFLFTNYDNEGLCTKARTQWKRLCGKKKRTGKNRSSMFFPRKTGTIIFGQDFTISHKVFPVLELHYSTTVFVFNIYHLAYREYAFCYTYWNVKLVVKKHARWLAKWPFLFPFKRASEGWMMLFFFFGSKPVHVKPLHTRTKRIANEVLLDFGMTDSDWLVVMRVDEDRQRPYSTGT